MGKAKANKKAGGLGKALTKSISKATHVKNLYIAKHGAELLDIDKPKLVSVVERNALDDFLYNAEIANERFEQVRAPKLIIQDSMKDQVVININEKSKFTLSDDAKTAVLAEMKDSRIPRRPKWDGIRDADTQKLLENTNFINWRRELSLKEEAYRFITMTPYEKNVEIWKQLWRVLEKSDIIVQIVDGRDPLFFRCEDLETYAKEIDSSKLNLMLINKADLVHESVRKVWSDWFNKNGVQHLYFSAKDEQEIVDELPDEEAELATDNFPLLDDVSSKKLFMEYMNTPRIINRGNLMQILKSYIKDFKDKLVLNGLPAEKTLPDDKKADGEKTEVAEGEVVAKKEPVITIGMLGFPNVGKSSIINVLCKKKLVGVDARPGKTKNYQTIFLDKNLLLCDCPGLVFPTIASSKSEMICLGVLPVDNLKDWNTPIEYITSRIPKSVLSYNYKLNLESKEKFVTANHLLFAYATHRGFVTGSGQPDLNKASRLVLKDFNTGKLLFCNLPENFDWKNHNYGAIEQFNLLPDNFVPPQNLGETEAILTSKPEKENPNIKTRKYQAETILLEQKLNEEFFHGMGQKMEALDEENVIDLMDENDILDLVAGKVVLGVKLNKPQRRDIKFAIKRDEPTSVIEIMLTEFIYGVKKEVLKLDDKTRNPDAERQLHPSNDVPGYYEL
jgi:large subunit GTPase 1